VQRVHHLPHRTSLLAVETLFLQALSSRSFLFETRAGMTPSGKVYGSSGGDLQLWNDA